MQISMIAAMANNRVIGKNNEMPWYLPEDLKHFKAMTLGKPVVMGRKTFEAIGRPLPGRRNIVITRNADYQHDGISCVQSFDDAIKLVLQQNPQCLEIMVIGGGQLYLETLSKAQKLYLTEIDLTVEGDTWFPEWNDGNWKLDIGSLQTSEKGLQFRFVEATRQA